MSMSPVEKLYADYIKSLTKETFKIMRKEKPHLFENIPNTRFNTVVPIMWNNGGLKYYFQLCAEKNIPLLFHILYDDSWKETMNVDAKTLCAKAVLELCEECKKEQAHYPRAFMLECIIKKYKLENQQNSQTKEN